MEGGTKIQKKSFLVELEGAVLICILNNQNIQKLSRLPLVYIIGGK